LYLRPLAARQAAFGGQSNARPFVTFVIFMSFVVKETPFASVSPLLL
jgi:hypothetical protein